MGAWTPPKTWVEAEPTLRWALRRRFTPLNVLRAARLGEDFAPVEGPRLGELVVRLVADEGPGLRYVQRRHLEAWGVTAQVALEAGRRRVEAEVGDGLSMRDGVVRVSGREASARLALPGFVAGLGPAGTVACAPDQDLVLAGPPAVAAVVLRAFREAESPLSPQPFVASGASVAPARTGLASLAALAVTYDDQAELLLDDPDTLEEGLVLAGLTLHPDGRRTATRWTPGTPTWLPRADVVVVGGEPRLWEELASALGPELTQVAGVDPPRWRCG